jgi:hypothetical protein
VKVDLLRDLKIRKSTWEEISNITSDGWINHYDRLLLNSREERNDKLVYMNDFLESIVWLSVINFRDNSIKQFIPISF